MIPPVIENLLKASEQALEELSNLYEIEEDNYLNQAIAAVKQYKKQLEQDDLISLIIRSSGDQSVGIGQEEIEVKMWRGYIRPDDSLRKEVKKLFADAVETLFETSLGDVRFEDECVECGAILNSKKCPNKNCISNE